LGQPQRQRSYANQQQQRLYNAPGFFRWDGDFDFIRIKSVKKTYFLCRFDEQIDIGQKFSKLFKIS
jgi:hypothetical protein